MIRTGTFTPDVSILSNLPDVEGTIWRLAIRHRMALVGATGTRRWLEEQMANLDQPSLYDQMLAEGWAR